MTASAEELREVTAAASGALVALAAGDSGLAHARVVLGLEPVPEADSPGAQVGRTACSWCGRANPEGGLTQDSPPGCPAPGH